MRILHITDGIPPLVLGGSGRIVWETAKGLTKQGHAVTILTAAPEEALPDRLEGIRILTLPPRDQRFAHYRSVFSLKRSQEVLWAIEEVDPDIIHCHVLAWQMGYRWIGEVVRRGIPIVATAHDVMHVAFGRVTGLEWPLIFHDFKRTRWTMNPLRNLLIRRYLRKVQRILCVSDALRRYMERRGFKSFEALQTLHHGIDLEFWNEVMPKEQARKNLGLSNDAPIFLLAGRIGLDKGSRIVAACLPKKAHLILAGNADWETFKPLGSRLSVFKNQSSEEMRTLYAACDCALVPSICLDCFPTVCLEAMACSRPVVATSWGGAKEGVTDGKTGWIIDPLDTEAFRKRLAWCADHREELPPFGKRGRLHMEQHFSLDHYLTKLTKIYKECLPSS